MSLKLLDPVTLFIREIEDAQAAINDLRKFIPLAWRIVEPGTRYVHGWHIDAMADHLMAVTRGQILDLLINVPPRHCKSTIVSVIWPVWEWISHPSVKWLYSSYAQSLSTRDSLKSRRLIQSPWFVKHYSDRFKLLKDQNTKQRYDNDKMGYRIATSVTGSNTGEGGDRIVCVPYETKIRGKYGYTQIGRIVEQQQPIDVYSFNKLRRKVELKRILRFFTSQADSIQEITLENGNSLKCTPNHRIWTGNRQWVHAKDINQHDILMDSGGNPHLVDSNERIDGRITVYNIEVEDNNNYFANDLLVHNCDDGNNAAEGESKAVLESTAIWWKEVMSTRKNDPRLSTRVVVGQRVSQLDISQIFMESADPVHLCLPAEYEKPKDGAPKPVTKIGWSDPREEEGELLWGQRFTQEILAALKIELGTYGTASQLQQRPVPRGGGILKEKWFQPYKLVRDLHGRIIKPQFKFVVQSWDTAFEEGKENDYSACVTLGLNYDGFFVINRWMKRVDFPELLKVAIELANIYNPNQLFVEGKASGKSLIQSFRKQSRLPIKEVNPDRDKVARMYSVSPIVEAGKLFMPDDEHWKDDFQTNLVQFPAVAHDDDVDAVVQALIELAVKKADMGDKPRAGSIIGR